MKNSNLLIETKTFSELSVPKIYEMYRFRIDVFVVERDCVYTEVDGKDFESLHLFIKKNEELIGYARIIPPGLKYEHDVAIGRVIVKKEYRKQKIGLILMENALKVAKNQWPTCDIRLSAQAHLEHFYNLVGFKRITDNYLEEKLPHVGMKYFEK